MAFAGLPEPPWHVRRGRHPDPWAGLARRPPARRRRGSRAGRPARTGPRRCRRRSSPSTVAPDRPGPRASSSVADGRRDGGPRAISMPVDHLAGPQQDGRGVAVRTGDNVGAPMHSVDEVGVQVAGRAEHHRGARRAPAEGVRGRVVRRPAYASTSVSRTATVPAAVGQPSPGRADPGRRRSPRARRTNAAEASLMRTPGHGAIRNRW